MVAAAGIVMLLAELAFVLASIVGHTSWFSWGPNDYFYRYRIHTTVDGHPLGEEAVEERYRLGEDGIFEDRIEALFDLIRQYERTYGRADHATVVVRYRRDDGASRTWRLESA